MTAAETADCDPTEALNIDALEIARLLTSGLAGRRLHDELRRRFPSAARPDVYLGIVMAITLYEGHLTIAEADLAALQALRPDI